MFHLYYGNVRIPTVPIFAHPLKPIQLQPICEIASIKITPPWLIYIVQQMHRAAFVLPTFAKRELEAYCASAETVSYLRIVTSDF